MFERSTLTPQYFCDHILTLSVKPTLSKKNFISCAVGRLVVQRACRPNCLIFFVLMILPSLVALGADAILEPVKFQTEARKMSSKEFKF